MKYKLLFTILFLSLVHSIKSQAQTDSANQSFTLEGCIEYALKNQPLFKESLLDAEIAQRTIDASRGAWLPQVRMEYNLTHWMKLPVSFFPNFSDPTGPRVPIRAGLPNVSNALFQADQVIFNNEVLLASRLAHYSSLQAGQNIESSRINVTVTISKAFYDVLVTEQQLAIVNQDLERQQKLYTDAYNMYQAGVTDKVDYRRTSIALNNSLSQKKRVQENIGYKYAYLKQLMGYPDHQDLKLVYEKSGMEQQAYLDTNQTPEFTRRIEYQMLQNQKQIQSLNEKYYQRSYLPSISGFINYNLLYQTQNFGNLYNKSYPNSAMGIKAAIPIFQGGRRYQNLQKARLQVKRAELDIEWFKGQVGSQYAQAMAVYKSNLNDLKIQQQNMAIANEVYELIKLQYSEGIKTYLDVITSESDLRASQFNYLNALYNLLASKLDVQRALGNINQ